MNQVEQILNSTLAGILQEMAPKSDIYPENTSVLREGNRYQPDILIVASGRSPVIIEAKIQAPRDVEDKAKSRLGAKPEGQTRPVEAVIALIYPEELKTAGNMKAEIDQAILKYCFFQEARGTMAEPIRFPETGWIEGTTEDLSDLIRMISVPQKEVDKAAEALERGIEDAALILDEVVESRPRISADIAFRLGMDDNKETRHMACAIIANAMIFHERIAGMHDDEIRIDSLRMVCAAGDPLEKLTDAWRDILDYNYFPIYSIANDILAHIPTHRAPTFLNRLRRAARQVEYAGVTYAHDLTGRVFQNLISGRKFLATFYTKPASAALLARLAVSKMRGVRWRCRESIEQLRIADFACGTGALISAVYDQIAARHERAEGDLDALHDVMMKEVLYGCDVIPAAVHITASTLAGARPSVKLENSRLYTMPYGYIEKIDEKTKKKIKAYSIGSLDLLDNEQTFTMFNTSDPGKRTGNLGEETATEINFEIKDESFDLIIMNPPFTRAASDWEGIKRKEDYVKQFRGLNTSLDTQKKMSETLKENSKDTCYHGFAGLGSAFAALIDKKLKPGGILAMVLPLTAASGQSWLKLRQMLTARYSDIDVLSIAAAGNDEVSFSEDTNMAECLIIARKTESGSSTLDKKDTYRSTSIRFTSLRKSPSSFVEASELAKQIMRADERRIDKGPYGGSSIHIGGDHAGETITADVDANTETWGAVRIQDYSVAQAAYSLTQSKIWMPGKFESFDLPMVPFKKIGTRSLNAMNVAKSSVAPFDLKRGRPSSTATYPSIWSHNAQNETRLVCEPDSELQARQGKEERAGIIASTASRCHHNVDFRYNSQPLAVAFTKDKTIGGRAWPSVSFDDDRFDYVFSIWGNSSLGLLMHWWHANLQQPGRGSISITALDSLPTLDLHALSDAQLTLAKEIFERFAGKESTPDSLFSGRKFQPAFRADLDQARADLDRAVLCELLGFDESVYVAVRQLSAKWAAEPSVRGSKRRPDAPCAV